MYQKNPGVQYVEPDFEAKALGTPGDPMFSQQWDMTKIAAPQAWDTQTAAGDVVFGDY